MSNFEPLKAGQAVFLKRPAQIYAEVIGPHQSDLGLPAEQVQYAVQLLPLEQHYLREDLETAAQPLPRKSQVSEAGPLSTEDTLPLSEADTKVSATIHSPISVRKSTTESRTGRMSCMSREGLHTGMTATIGFAPNRKFCSMFA